MSIKHPIATENAARLASNERLTELCEADAPKKLQRAEHKYYFETVLKFREDWVKNANASLHKERKADAAVKQLAARDATIKELKKEMSDLSKQIGQLKDANAQLRIKYEKPGSRVPKDVIVPDSPVAPY